jgi:pimeloyl-ACP methyl ester carboxylesterase
MFGARTVGLSETGTIVNTAAGPAFVRALGAGPPVLVVHGGPGFDHTYLVGALEALRSRRTLFFYDQPGCGRTPAPVDGVSLAQTVDHLSALSEVLFAGAPYGVIAHSWGVLVLIAAASQMPSGAPFSEGLLINPVPITGADYGVALRRLLARIPGEVTAKFFADLQSGGSGAEAMRAILPFYRTHPFAVSVDPFPLTPSTYLAIAANLSEFDFSAGQSRLANVSLLLAEDDFTGADLVAGIGDACRDVCVMKQTGHFPFFEDPQSFAAILGRCFG